jgi:hypothetical protein
MEDLAHSSSEESAGKSRKRSAKRSAGKSAFLFVLAAFLFWFMFASLAQIVITCAPVGCSLKDLQPLRPMGRREMFVMVISLLTALWVSSRIFFPSEE